MKPTFTILQPKATPPASSYWVGATREQLNQKIAERRPFMDTATAKDFDPTWITPGTAKGEA